MSNKIYVGRKVSYLDFEEEFLPFSKVRAYRSSDTWYEAGDDTGRTLEFTNPWATQAMAEAVLRSVKGFVYRPFSASGALLPIDTEVGDGLTIGGKYTFLANQTITLDSLSVSDISSPGDESLNHEYPFKTFQQKETERENKRIYSLITKTDEEIRLLVANKVAGLESSITQTAESIRLEVSNVESGLSSEIEQTESSLTSTINGVKDGLQSQINQKIDSVSISVSNGDTSSSLTLTVDGVAVSSHNITFTGFVTFTGLSGGTTTIDGACIKTGTIDAERLNLTGAITFRDLSEEVGLELTGAAGDAQRALEQAANALSSAYTALENSDAAYNLADSANSTVSGWSYGGSTYIDGGMIATGTVLATKIGSGYVALLDNTSSVVGSLSIAAGSSARAAVRFNVDALAILSSVGDVYLEAGDGAFFQIQSGINISGAGLRPSRNDFWSLGTASYKWADIYAQNSTINTSDRREKKEIKYDLSTYEGLFDSLKPCSFRFIGRNRTHLGMISQDVEQSMNECGVSDMDFAGFIKDGDSYGLRYGEFIPLLIDQIQKLKKRVEALESE